MEYILDGCLMSERESAYDYIAQKLGFPEYFGHNSDALADCLSELSGVKLTIINEDIMLENAGAFAEKLLRVFREAAGRGFIELIEIGCSL